MRSESGEKGFGKKSYAPAFIASTAVSTVPYAVISTTGITALVRFAACRNSRPLIPGNLRSVKMRSTFSCRNRFSPASASPAM